jgi:carboxyl-terminal processing protease
MKKTLIIVGVLVMLGALVMSAFAGGMVVGRFTMRQAPPAQQELVPPPQEIAPPDRVEGEAPPVEELLEPEEATPAPDEPRPTPPVEESFQPREPRDPGLAPVEAFDYELLETVLELLEEQFYGEIPSGEDLTYGAIRGMLMTLGDPYTSFIEPRITAILNEDASGEFEGIGAMVQMRDDGYLEVSSVMPNQPAEEAGVLAGDLIVAVGDQSLVGLGLYEAISFIRGPAGTDAELEILRPGVPDPVFITVTRARIEIQIVETRMLDNDIAYLRLTEFDATAARSVEDALDELLAQNPRGLVFDLRNNPGGWLNQAIAVADLFLDRGLVAIQRDSTGREQRFSSQSGEIGESIPMVVLINRGSASASEIVAGAIQDRERAVLVGTVTLGKGSVQLPNNLDDGSQVRITIARWYTPNEQVLHGTGLTPDIEVEITAETPVGEDPQLEAATQYLLEGMP